MKYLLNFLLAFCLLAESISQARIDTAKEYKILDDWSKTMESDPKDKWSRLLPSKRFYVYSRLSDLESAKSSINQVVGYYGNANIAWLNGQAELELAATGITKANADSFWYHVVINDSIEIVPWQHPSQFRSNSIGNYAYLGKFASLHKIIKFEIYQTGDYPNRRIIYFNNLYTPTPEIYQARLLYNDPYLFKPFQQHFIPPEKSIMIGGYKIQLIGNTTNPTRVQMKTIPPKSFEWSDSINHIAVSIMPTLLNEIYQVYLRHYTSISSDTVFISNKWNSSAYGPFPQLMVNASYFKKPGNYELIVVAKVPDEFNRTEKPSQASLFFSVKPSSVIQFSTKQVILYTGLLVLIGGSGFFYYRSRNRRQLAKQQQEKEIAMLQLRAVRSQLNPHFMFNALSGIQNLMNKHENIKASDYLSRFARITRQVLKESDQEMNSLQDEIKLLDDYLLMEQLRFGFQYSIQTAGDIDLIHTDIPSMILQPLVENAVKHGVSDLAEKGYVEISIQKETNQLVLLVKDNGKGFSLTDKNTGHGLRLIKERIKIHNKLYPDATILFDTLSIEGYCVCKLELNHWL
jgi:two-component system LytT family sensor kinase